MNVTHSNDIYEPRLFFQVCQNLGQRNVSNFLDVIPQRLATLPFEPNLIQHDPSDNACSLDIFCTVAMI